MKNARLAIISIGLILMIGFFVITKHSEPAGKCGPYRKDKVVTIGNLRVNAEVVQSQTELAKGLGERPCIESDQAMLFVFNRSGQQRIWMKDMKFPIDILWISKDLKVVGVERDVKPSTYPDVFANKDKPALYVLELKSNASKAIGSGLGQSVKF